MWKNFPKLTVGKHYQQVLVRVLQLHMGIIHKDRFAPNVQIDGHQVANNGDEFAAVDNYQRGMITLYNVTVLETKLLSIPKGVFPSGPQAGTFSSAVCKVTAARIH